MNSSNEDVNVKDELTFLRKEIVRLENLLFASGLMLKSPCFLCGYNGPGYYQPNIHSCANRHHENYSTSTSHHYKSDHRCVHRNIACQCSCHASAIVCDYKCCYPCLACGFLDPA